MITLIIDSAGDLDLLAASDHGVARFLVHIVLMIFTVILIILSRT